MSDFKFVEIPNLEQWIILAPKRSKRLNRKIKKGKSCPFCEENGKREKELFRIGGEDGDPNWLIRVIPNKFPFAPIHEIVIQTRDHDKHFHDFSIDEIKLVFEAYVNRYNKLKSEGTVCIFANSGGSAGESISHAHAQIAVIPKNIPIVVPKLEKDLEYRGENFSVGEFLLVSPPYSQWPDEVWIVPKRRDRKFGEIEFEEIENLAFIMKRLIRIFEIRHGFEYPYNYYIYPYRDWYLRIIPRAKIPGGFEIATGIFVNTQDPSETMKFIKDHFYDEEEEKIKKSKARYRKGV